jgi:putative glutamine amidotransferase
MKKPVIGITLDNEKPGGYSKFPWYAIRHNYLHSIELYGGIPFPLFHANKYVEDIFHIIDGLIITGGNFDINPKVYGEKQKATRIIKSNRTNFEIAICQKFLNSSKPVLGICGGEQLLNVVCGGTLIQDIRNHNPNALKHEQKNPRNETSHQVNIKKNTKLSMIMNKIEINVNSAHHQAVHKLGNDLIATGYALDGTIESIEHIKHNWCIGVQWHPEFLITNEDNLLIENFIKTAGNI